MPPDICIELALWDRFGWGPDDTDKFTLKQMRELFSVLEQQRISKNAVEELGPPSEHKLKAIIAKQSQETAAKTTRSAGPTNPSTLKPKDMMPKK